MRSYLIFFSIFISFNITTYAADKDYWKTSGLTFQDINALMKKGCYVSAKDFQSCIEGINTIAKNLQPQGIFASLDEVRRNPKFFGTRINSYGDYTLYTRLNTGENLSPRLAWEDTKLIRATRIQAAYGIFPTLKQHHLKFENVVRDLKPKVLRGELKDSEAAIAGQTINSILGSAMDPHTRIEPTAQFADEVKPNHSPKVSIGATLKISGDKLLVIDLKRGGPCFQAGLKVNDSVDSVEGHKVTEASMDEVLKSFSGAAGSSFQIEVLRKTERLHFVVIRQIIVPKAVEARVVDDAGEKFGYLKPHNFMDDHTCQEMADDVANFETQGVSGIILDLRDNPGGEIGQATCTASLFVGQKVIVKVGNLKGKIVDAYLGQNDQMTKLPLITLINGQSASSSEVLAGALQDYKRAWIMGDRSFGKATVQINAKEWNKKTEIFQTYQRFYEPSGRTSQIVGISPDLYIDPIPHATADDKFVLREEDSYTNALPALGKPWIQPRPQQVSQIQSCLQSQGFGEKIYEQHTDDQIPPDLQIITAQLALGCEKHNANNNLAAMKF
jgi:carboxyl-terminal processing protease